MRKSYNDVALTIKAVWPHLRDIWLVDPAYWLPTPDELAEGLARTITHRQTYLPDIADCDDFALQLHAEISRMRAWSAKHREIPREEWLPWAFGQCLGVRFHGRNMNHAINICLTTDGLRLIEPQNNNIWIPTPEDDMPYFVRI